MNSKTPAHYIEGDPITVKSGAVVAWITFHLCEASQLQIRKWPEGVERRCRNAWVFIEDGEERTMVLAKRPVPQQVPGNHRTRLSLEYVDPAKLEDEINSYLSADCWAVYVADKNQLLGVRHSYLDARFSRGAGNRDHISIPELRAHLDDGHTLVLVMGSTEFMEYYFSRVPGVAHLYGIAIVDHQSFLGHE